MSEPLHLDRVWDEWCSAIREDSGLSPDAFAARYGANKSEILEILGPALTLRGAGKLEPLIEILAGPIPEGFEFAGYRLIRRIGEGASGIVFEAQIGNEAPVALKILNPLVVSTREWRAAILREGELATRLTHPGIVRVVGHGVERGYAWVASELIRGRSLKQEMVAARTPSSRREIACSIGSALADALGHAHERGIIHRDLKPSNVIIDPNRRPRIFDFGLALDIHASTFRARQNEVAGTVAYMAPEQARGESVGSAVDQYALGVILLEIASGQSLAQALGRNASVRDVALGRYRPSRSLLKKLPVGLRIVIRRATELDPRNRYQNLFSMNADLIEVAAGRVPLSTAIPLLRRVLFAAYRRPVRTMSLLGAVIIPSFLAYYLWSIEPGFVHFNSFQNAKELVVDDLYRGITPISFTLRPGKHEYRMDFIGSGNPKSQYSGAFEVRRGEVEYIFVVGDYPRYVPVLEDNAGVAWDKSAWLWIAVGPSSPDPLALPPDLAVTIDGREVVFEDRKPLGVVRVAADRQHEVVISANGFRELRREVRISAQSLRLLAVELDPIDSPATKLVYSPIDAEIVPGGIVTRNVHQCIEYIEQNGLTTQDVHKLFWAPNESFEEGSVELWVNLPEVVEKAIKLEWTDGDQWAFGDAWSGLWAGPSEDELVLVLLYGKGRSASPGAMLELSRRMIGHQRMFLRARCGDALVGNESAYASLFRSSAMPRVEGDDYFWSPALRITVN